MMTHRVMLMLLLAALAWAQPSHLPGMMACVYDGNVDVIAFDAVDFVAGERYTYNASSIGYGTNLAYDGVSGRVIIAFDAFGGGFRNLTLVAIRTGNSTLDPPTLEKTCVLPQLYDVKLITAGSGRVFVIAYPTGGSGTEISICEVNLDTCDVTTLGSLDLYSIPEIPTLGAYIHSTNTLIWIEGEYYNLFYWIDLAKKEMYALNLATSAQDLPIDSIGVFQPNNTILTVGLLGINNSESFVNSVGQIVFDATKKTAEFQPLAQFDQQAFDVTTAWVVPTGDVPSALVINDSTGTMQLAYMNGTLAVLGKNSNYDNEYLCPGARDSIFGVLPQH